MADERRLTKAEADAAIATLAEGVGAATKAMRRAQTDSGISLLRQLNEISGAFASAEQAIRIRQTAPDVAEEP